MRPRPLSFLLVLSSLFCAPAAGGAQATSTVHGREAEGPAPGRTFLLPDGMGTFSVPCGFREATSAEMRAFARTDGPERLNGLWLSPRGDALLSLITAPSDAPITALPKLKRYHEEWVEEDSTFSAWITREVVEIGGHRWVHLEVMHDQDGLQRRRHILQTLHRGQFIQFYYASIENVYPRYRDSILASSRSIRLEP